MAMTATTPTTTPAAMPATLVLDLCSLLVTAPLLEVAVAAEVGDKVTSTVVPGATLVTTEGAAVVVPAADVAFVPDEVVVAESEALDDEEDAP